MGLATLRVLGPFFQVTPSSSSRSVHFVPSARMALVGGQSQPLGMFERRLLRRFLARLLRRFLTRFLRARLYFFLVLVRFLRFLARLLPLSQPPPGPAVRQQLTDK